jgi:hypothetical protein
MCLRSGKITHLGVLGGAEHVEFADVVLAMLFDQLALQLVEVEGRQRLPGSAVGRRLALEHLGAERLGEAAGRLTDEALEVLHHRRGEVELLGLLQQALLVQIVLHHELRQIAHHLRARRHLDDVPEQSGASRLIQTFSHCSIEYRPRSVCQRRYLLAWA